VRRLLVLYLSPQSGGCGAGSKLTTSTALTGEPAVKVDADSTPPEGHPLYLQSQALLLAAFPRQSDAAPCPHDTVPGQSLRFLQCPHGEASPARESCGLRHLAIGDHPAPWAVSDNSAETRELGHGSVPETTSSLGDMSVAFPRSRARHLPRGDEEGSTLNST
jgi:hypothetical protein